jgi:hypothetical protein
MKQYLGFAKRLSLLFTPLVATSVLFTSPSQAATFSLSTGELKFTNFSEVFSINESDNQANNPVFANGGIVTAENKNVIIDITDTPPGAFTVADSSAFGEGKDYEGLATTEAKILLNFDIAANQTFSFDFTSFLDLETEIDAPPVENAQASGDIAFYLFDTSDISEQALPDFLTNLVDNPSSINRSPFSFFSLVGNLSTVGDDFINIQNGPDITLINNFKDVFSVDNLEFATASFGGSFQRYFENPTNITLIATRRSQARVTAPEPSTSLAFLLFLALLAVTNKAKLQANISRRFVKVKFIKLAVED